MASLLPHSTTTLSTTSRSKRHRLPLLPPRIPFSSSQQKPIVERSESSFSFQTLIKPCYPQISVTRTSPNDFLTTTEKEKPLSLSEKTPVKLLVWVLLWASLALASHALAGNASAADSIRASGFGLKVANALRALGWPDEAVVVALATLPVIELRGAIPVGYWLQMKPIKLTALSIIGNMVPVPFIILYLNKLATFLTGKNQSASRFLNMLLERAKRQAEPVKEFRWLGLMLFVAVPFPGTGAWTGAFIASILEMPLWQGISANFVGVVLAALLVNLLVNLGIKYALAGAVLLFVISTFMWSILHRFIRGK